MYYDSVHKEGITDMGVEGRKDMRDWMSKAVVALLVTLLLLPGVSHALMLEQTSLVGLKGINVLVEDMNPQAERLGLTTAEIQKDVELRLRKAGIRILTEKESSEMPGIHYLLVRVNTYIRSGSPLCAFNIRVLVKQTVTLETGFSTVATIWNTEALGSVETDNIRKIRDSVGGLVDKFINDYLAANPKK